MILFAMLHRFFALLSLALLVLSAWLAWTWWEVARDADMLDLAPPSRDRLYWALGLLAFSLLGRFPILGLLGRGGPMGSTDRREGALESGADGSRLRLEVEGRTEGPIVLLTHAWGMSSRIWADTREALSTRFGVVVWDLPGAGLSSRPFRNWSLDGFADDLKAVIECLPVDRPIVLVGHSIGGMTIQNLCLRHPETLSGRISGVVLENTTDRNPLETMVLAPAATALQPLVVAGLKLDIAFSPLLWLLNWQSYLSGGAHLAMRLAGFGSRPTRAQLDLAARLPTRTSPAVQAHGNLAMIRWSGVRALPGFGTPALVIVGGRDLVTLDRAGERIAATLGAALLKVGHAGHMGPVERHDLYVRAVENFVDQTCLPQPSQASPP